MNEYLNFDLLISHSEGDSYLAHVINSEYGEGSNVFQFSFDVNEIKKHLEITGNTRKILDSDHLKVNNKNESSIKVIKDFGSALFDSVFQGEVLDLYKSNIITADHQDKGLRIRLRLNNDNNLISLPWEFLFDTREDSFIGIKKNKSIVRYMEMQSPLKASYVSKQLNILVIISSPENYPALDHTLEKNNFRISLKQLIDDEIVTIKFLQNASIENLLKELRSSEYHIIHFIGHGGFDEYTDEGALIFEDDNHQAVKETGNKIALALQNERTLKLIFINACNSGVTSSQNIYSGVAQSLVKKSIPAVVAMQYQVTDQSAIVFSEEFYTSLAKGDSIDVAMTSARSGIYFGDKKQEFGVATLYMRSKTGNLFFKKDKHNKSESKDIETKILTKGQSFVCTLIFFIYLIISFLIASALTRISS